MPIAVFIYFASIFVFILFASLEKTAYVVPKRMSFLLLSVVISLWLNIYF